MLWCCCVLLTMGWCYIGGAAAWCLHTLSRCLAGHTPPLMPSEMMSQQATSRPSPARRRENQTLLQVFKSPRVPEHCIHATLYQLSAVAGLTGSQRGQQLHTTSHQALETGVARQERL
ncbi:hypothetical protein O3P69_018476 [Scylla paramamosain]|uniref:Secreted protein n=1 Tax=Scylla paramamosain TaxID=85552 RepID=A0AAW0T378_SCYPA